MVLGQDLSLESVEINHKIYCNIIMKNAIIILVAVVLLLAVLMILRGNEDTWLCQNGQWVKHGNPSSAMPIKECK